MKLLVIILLFVPSALIAERMDVVPKIVLAFVCGDSKGGYDPVVLGRTGEKIWIYGRGFQSRNVEKTETGYKFLSKRCAQPVRISS